MEQNTKIMPRCLLVLAAVGSAAPLTAGQCEVLPVAETTLPEGLLPNGRKAIARDGDTVVVGSIHNGTNGLTAGAAHVYRRVGSAWVFQTTLIPGDVTAQDQFGSSVAIEGDTIVVGADHQDSLGTDTGAAYVFTFDGDAWTQQAKLLPTLLHDPSFFGGAVGIADGRILVGAPGDTANGMWAGAVYEFTNDGSGWTLSQTFRPADNDSSDFFGWSISMDGSRVAIGAFNNEPPDGPTATLPGSVYIFNRGASGWTESANLFPPDSSFSGTGAFGTSVDLAGDELIVGAPNSSFPGTHTGAAFVYRFGGGAWDDGTRLLPAGTLQPGDRFGEYVAIDGGVAVVDAEEAHFFPTPPGPGRITVYTADGADWHVDSTFVGGVSGFVSHRNFGISPVLSGNELVLGTDVIDLNTGDGFGKLVTLDLGCVGMTCGADLTGDGVLDLGDIQAFIAAFLAHDPAADFAAPFGVWDLADLSAFIAEFNAGCP